MTTETPTPTSNAPAAAPAIPEAPPLASSSDFTPAQLKDLADDLVARGSLTREDAEAMLVVDGVPLDKPKSEGELSPEAAEIDAMFPPAKPEEYQMPSMGDEYGPTQHKLDTDARGWLAEARFPAGLGSALLSEIDRVSVAHSKMSDGERQIWAQKEVAVLQNMWGDSYGPRVKAAQQIIKELELKRPGLVEILEVSGAGNSAFVIAQVALHAERLLARRPKPKA